MAKTLTDLRQLTKAILKGSPHPAQTPLRATASQSGDMPRPAEKPAPEPSQSREDADAAVVLAYFSSSPQKTPEELAAIAYLDKLRTCEGEAMPVGLPLAVFQPKPVKDDFLAKLRLHRKRYGW